MSGDSLMGRAAHWMRGRGHAAVATDTDTRPASTPAPDPPESSEPGSPPPSEPSADTGAAAAARVDLAVAGRVLEEALPFAGLLAILLLQRHFRALAALLWMTAAFHRGSESVKHQAALRADRSPLTCMSIAAAMAAHGAAVAAFVAGPGAWRHLLLLPMGSSPPQGVLDCFWRVAIADTQARYATVALKALMLLSPPKGGAAGSRSRSAALTLAEYATQFYRALLPAPVWFSLFCSDADGRTRALASALGGTYLAFKAASLYDRLMALRISARAATGRVSGASAGVGRPAGAAEVAESGGTCSVCLLAMAPERAVALRGCGHLFCDECVCAWAECNAQQARAMTCPVCRAVVKDSGPGLRSYGDGGTSFALCVF